MPHRGLEPASVLRLAFQSDALPAELSPSPLASELGPKPSYAHLSDACRFFGNAMNDEVDCLCTNCT